MKFTNPSEGYTCGLKSYDGGCVTENMKVHITVLKHIDSLKGVCRILLEGREMWNQVYGYQAATTKLINHLSRACKAPERTVRSKLLPRKTDAQQTRWLEGKIILQQLINKAHRSMRESASKMYDF